MSVFTDKEGYKHYRMKADTGYLDSKGGSLNGQKNEVPKGENLQFNYVHLLVHPMKRIRISVPGLNQFGLKRIIIRELDLLKQNATNGKTEAITGEVIFDAPGFTIFGMTRCSISKEAQRRMVIGKKYQITIKKWTK